MLAVTRVSFLLSAAGWKLTPMVGAMYSPELYTGVTSDMAAVLR